MNTSVLEKYVVNLIYEGNVIAKLELIRYLCPILIERIVRIIPTKALILISRNKILINVNVPYGASREKIKHEAGDVAYDAFNRAIVIYLSNEVDNLENIGRVFEGFSNLSRLKTGTFVELNLEEKLKPSKL